MAIYKEIDMAVFQENFILKNMQQGEFGHGPEFTDTVLGPKFGTVCFAGVNNGNNLPFSSSSPRCPRSWEISTAMTSFRMTPWGGMPSFLRPGPRKIRKSAAYVFSFPVERFYEG